MKKGLIVLLMLTSLFGCRRYAELPVVKDVDLSRYAGKWYEISTIPIGPQRGCECTTAEYTVSPEGYVVVYNRCMKAGGVSEITGKAFPVESSGNAKLKVQFFWPFKADYWIIDLAPDYSYAVVGHPSRDYLWILSRTPQMDEATYNMLLTSAQNNGYDISRLVRTKHPCSDTLR